jgi:hypothetical protein
MQEFVRIVPCTRRLLTEFAGRQVPEVRRHGSGKVRAGVMIAGRPILFCEGRSAPAVPLWNSLHGKAQDMDIHGSSPLRCLTALVLLLLTLTAVSWARAKKDVIQFANGDRITCEIIKLEKGYLYVKLEYADGTVAMDWSKIVRVESPQGFVVADKAGLRFTGHLETATGGNTPEELEVRITGSTTDQVVPGKEVVEIGQTESSFWQNLNGGMSVGLNFSKQQSRTQYTFQSNANFQRAKWSAAANFQSNFSGGGDLSSLRNDLQLNGTRQLYSPRNFYRGLAEFLQSNEQQLDLRTTLGAAIGHVFSNTNNSFVTAYGGMDWNKERYSAQATVGQTGNSAEALLGTQLNFFRFKTTNFLVTATVYPSLTDLGRTRFDLNTSLKLKIAKDLYWNFSYFLNVDSRPPQGLPKTDYGSTSSLGWTF